MITLYVALTTIIVVYLIFGFIVTFYIVYTGKKQSCNITIIGRILINVFWPLVLWLNFWAWLKNNFWFIIHNLIAHPLLVTKTNWANRFHDWTAKKM